MAILPTNLLSAQHENDLPDSVVFAISIDNFEKFKADVLQTSVAKYFNHPKVQECLSVDFGKQQNPVLELLLQQGQINSISGKVTFAIVQDGSKAKRFVSLMDFDNEDAAKEFAAQIGSVN